MCVFRAVEGGCGPEGGSWVPESQALSWAPPTGPEDMCTVEQRFKLTALAFFI